MAEQGWKASGAYDFFHETFLSKFFNKVWFERNEQKIFYLGEKGKAPNFLPGQPLAAMSINEDDLNSTLHADDVENPGAGGPDGGETGADGDTATGGTGGPDDDEETPGDTGGTGGEGSPVSGVAKKKKKVNLDGHVLPAGPAPSQLAMPAGPAAEGSPGQPDKLVVVKNSDAYSLHPSLRGKVITLSREDTLHHAIATLSKYEILSAPVIDNVGINIGFLEVFDIIRYFLQDFDAEGKKSGPDRLDSTCGEVITFSLRKPVEIPISARLSSVVPIFANGEYRMAVLNKRREDGGRFIGIFSQSDLLKFACPELRPNGRLQALGAFSIEKMMHEVTTARMGDTVMGTLRKMIEMDERSVCVVAENGVLVGDFAASDFRGFTANDFDNFKVNSWTVGAYMKSHGSLARANKPLTVKRHQTLYEVASLMLKEKMHHIYVADAEERPVGAIDLRDIMLFFVEFTPVVEIKCCGLTMRHLKWVLQGVGVVLLVIALYLAGSGSTVAGVSLIVVAVVLIGIGVWLHFRYSRQNEPLNDLKEMITRNLESRHNNQTVLDKFDALAPDLGQTPALADPTQQHEYGLTRAQIDHFAKVWADFDAKNRGFITADDLHDYMLRQGRATNAHEIGEFIRAFDLNGDGFVTFQEFLMVHSALLNKDPHAKEEDVNDTALPGGEEDGETDTALASDEEYEEEIEEEEELGAGNPLGLGPAPEGGHKKRKMKRRIKKKVIAIGAMAAGMGVGSQPASPEVSPPGSGPATRRSLLAREPSVSDREREHSAKRSEPSIKRDSQRENSMKRENSQNRRENSLKRENSLSRREPSVVKQSPKLQPMRTAQKLVDDLEKTWTIKSESRYDQPSVHVYNSVRGVNLPGTIRGTIRHANDEKERTVKAEKRPRTNPKQRPALPAEFNGGVADENKEPSVLGDRDVSRNSRPNEDGEAESVMGDDAVSNSGTDSRRSSINSLSSAHAISPFLVQATQMASMRDIAARQAKLHKEQREIKQVETRREAPVGHGEGPPGGAHKNSLSANSAHTPTTPRTPKSKAMSFQAAAAANGGVDPRSRPDQRSQLIVHTGPAGAPGGALGIPPAHPGASSGGRDEKDEKDEVDDVAGTSEGTEADPGVNLFPTQMEGGSKPDMSSPRHRALSKDDVDLTYEQKKERREQPGVMGWCSLDCGQIGVHRLRCAHVLCQNCSEKWSRNGQCPLCRTNAMMLTLEISPDNMSTTGVREKSPPSQNRGSFALSSSSAGMANPSPEGQIVAAPSGPADDIHLSSPGTLHRPRHSALTKQQKEMPLNYNRTLKKNPSTRRSMQV